MLHTLQGVIQRHWKYATALMHRQGNYLRRLNYLQIAKLFKFVYFVGSS